jgi:hypothetical protein
LGYVVPATSTHVAITSMTCPTSCATEPGVAPSPAGQCAIIGVQIPPSYISAFHSFSGVLATLAQNGPIPANVSCGPGITRLPVG